jgi:hypothetical protein
MRAFRKPVHESSKTSVLGLKLLQLEQSRRGQAAVALAPPIKSARRYVGCAANFGNGDTRIGFVQKVQNLAVSMLRVSHRPYAFMCHPGEALILDCRSVPSGAARLRFTVSQERIRCDCLIERIFFRLVEPNSFHGHARTAARIGGAFCHLRCACWDERSSVVTPTIL